MESGSSGFSAGVTWSQAWPRSVHPVRRTTPRSPALKGEMWVADGSLTVTLSDGRQKTAQVGNSRPAGLARLMLLELEEERLHGGPLSHSPETTE